MQGSFIQWAASVTPEPFKPPTYFSTLLIIFQNAAIRIVFPIQLLHHIGLSPSLLFFKKQIFPREVTLNTLVVKVLLGEGGVRPGTKHASLDVDSAPSVCQTLSNMCGHDILLQNPQLNSLTKKRVAVPDAKHRGMCDEVGQSWGAESASLLRGGGASC